MILKALYDYYHRCGDLAPNGMEYKEIAFIIVIDKKGHFLRLEDCRIDNKTTKKFLVVKGSRTSAPKPYLFWDNVEYALNYTKAHKEIQSKISDKKLLASINKSQIKHDLFVKQCIDVAAQYNDENDFMAVSLFYKNNGVEAVMKSDLWPEIEKKPTINVSFRINGSLDIVAENDKLLEYSQQSNDNNNDNSDKDICLITGLSTNCVSTTSATPIIGSQATAKLVSFQVNSGYDSYGKSQGSNATISVEAEACYTTALNRLLQKDSQNKFTIGNRTFVFWASNNSETSKQVESCFFNFLTNLKSDDPNRRIQDVRQVFNSIYSGHLTIQNRDKFFILGLAPNSARIAVIYWQETTIKDFAEKILKHFEDYEIIDTRKDPKPYYGMYNIISSVALQGKDSNVSPNLVESVMKSIIEGTPYPYNLFSACLRRIKAETDKDIYVTRAAILKGYLNRNNNINDKKIKDMLDKINDNIGYLCGRLFATLVKIQEEANGISSIRERYMNSASTTPAVVFANLLNLSIHHEEKLNPGRKIQFEQLKSEILDKVTAVGFPAHLDINDQARFFVGYYHQRQDFFTSKAEKENNETIINN